MEFLLDNRFEVIRFNSGGGKVAGGSSKGGPAKERFLWFYTWFGFIGQKRHKGVVDLYAWSEHYKAILWIEVKRAGGRRRPDQVRFIESIRKAGGSAHIVDSLDEAIQIVDDIRRSFNKDLVA